MSIVTFWSNGREQTGKTISLAAISTYMAIKHNLKILVISTSNQDQTLQNCFIAKQNTKTMSFGMFTPKNANTAMKSGMEGLVKMAKSNKITSEMIRNYTRIVFNNALEILCSNEEEEKEEDMSIYYTDIIKLANQYYDMVFVDLDTNIDSQIQQTIINDSDLIIANLSQRLSSIDKFIQERKQDAILNSRRTILLMGRYDKYSKFTAKNITRYMKETEIVLTMPYNTQLYDAAEDAGVPDFFLNFVKNPNLDKEVPNHLLFQEVNRAVETILSRLKEVQSNT